MKWRVDIEYEDGSLTEPRRIFFQAVYDGEPYHGYDTKKEALEAFCVGQVVMREMLKEREAEQKEAEQKCGEICGDNRFEIIKKAKKHLIEATNIETSKDEMACLDSFLFRCWQMGWLKQYEPKQEEGWDKAIKEAKEVAKAYEYFPRLKTCGEQKKGEEKEVKVDMSEETRKRLEKLAPISRVNIGWEAEAETSPYNGEMTEVRFNEVIDGYPTKEEALIAFVEEQKGKKYGDNFLPPEGYTNGKERKIMERLDKIENRLTEIDGVLSSIGSPEWELWKKVEELEKRLRNY